MKILAFAAAFMLLIALEVLRVYFIMPFPGSQRGGSIGPAYWLDHNISWLRAILLVLVAYSAFLLWKGSSLWRKIIVGLVLVIYGVVFYFFNFRFLADKMFREPRTVVFAAAAENVVKDDKLVLGVEFNGVAKAYPLQLIGYHHQIRDMVGGTPVMVTYCSVCRTGRVFSPMVNGKNETFRLVGMDQFNAMFEDATTKSWWRQVSGEAIAGPLKGKKLEELPSRQMSLRAWLDLYPASMILQPDPQFIKQYAGLAAYDDGTINSSLEKRDPRSWQLKSWVLGVARGKVAKAYDWNELVKKRLIEDSLPGLPLLITLEKDGASFHSFDRSLKGTTLHFTKINNEELMTDANTGSFWDLKGACQSGKLRGAQLERVQSYQEFWHSWLTFHPATLR